MQPDSERLERLIDLVHHRWNIPVLAELYRLKGAKFVTLARALSVSRASLSTSLNDLVALQLVHRNPGHGHPMRPEYLLTERGAGVGEQCYTLHRLLCRRDDQDLAFRKWTLPMVATLGHEVRRFNEVQRALPAATPRAIALALKSLLDRRWVRRKLIDDFPPTAGYELLARGRTVLGHVGGLVG